MLFNGQLITETRVSAQPVSSPRQSPQEIRDRRLKSARNQENRLRQITTDHEIENGTDYGPAIRHARGEIIREDRPDIEDESAYKRTIRGARRSDGLRSALSCGSIDYPQWLAGERLRNDLEIADGARDRQFGMPARDHTMCGPGEAQIDAMKRVREVFSAISAGNIGIIRAVVVHYRGLTDIMRHVPQRAKATASAKAKLASGLDEIATYYGETKRKNFS
jgi:Domain of unknown function (DUF6456)